MAEDVTAAEVEDWAVGSEKVLERIGPRFARSDPWVRAGAYLRGLLSTAERKNGWTLAEQAGMRRRMRCSGYSITPTGTPMRE